MVLGWTLQRQKSRHLEWVSRVLSTQKIERFDLTRFSRTPIHVVRRVRVRGNKSVIESILSSSSSYGNASVRPCLVPHGGVCFFSISFFSLSSSSSVEIQPGYGTDNDIDTDGNKASDLWWRFIAVFIAASKILASPAMLLKFARRVLCATRIVIKRTLFEILDYNPWTNRSDKKPWIREGTISSTWYYFKHIKSYRVAINT